MDNHFLLYLHQIDEGLIHYKEQKNREMYDFISDELHKIFVRYAPETNFDEFKESPFVTLESTKLYNLIKALLDTGKELDQSYAKAVDNEVAKVIEKLKSKK